MKKKFNSILDKIEIKVFKSNYGKLNKLNNYKIRAFKYSIYSLILAIFKKF